MRALWSDEFLYLAYESPFTQITAFEPTQKEERIGLWEKDVVEAFIGPDLGQPQRYTEFEWAPTGEQLDLKLDLPQKDFAWSSGMQSAVSIDEVAKIWRTEVRIPIKALSDKPPAPGARWNLNLFRHDAASHSGLAFNPTLQGSFHAPQRMGWLVFDGN